MSPAGLASPDTVSSRQPNGSEPPEPGLEAIMNLLKIAKPAVTIGNDATVLDAIKAMKEGRASSASVT